MALEKDKLITLAELGEKYGFSRDYLAFLCRTGQVAGLKTGRFWMSTNEAVSAYHRQITVSKAQRWEEMSREQSLPKPESPVVASESPVGEKRGNPHEIASSSRLGVVTPRNDGLRLGLFDRLVLAGLEKGAAFFSKTLSLAVLPLKWGFSLLNFGMRRIYYLPAAFGSLARSYALATVPLPVLYREYGGEQSLSSLYRRVERVKFAYTGALSFFIFVSFAYSLANFSGVQVNRYLSRGADALGSQIRQGRLTVWETEVRPQSLLVRDYLTARNTKDRVAGAFKTAPAALGLNESSTVADPSASLHNDMAFLVEGMRLAARTITVEEGINMKDQGTGLYYCVVIINGEFDKQSGKCGETALPP